jgi:hypothetical protein
VQAYITKVKAVRRELVPYLKKGKSKNCQTFSKRHIYIKRQGSYFRRAKRKIK